MCTDSTFWVNHCTNICIRITHSVIPFPCTSPIYELHCRNEHIGIEWINSCCCCCSCSCFYWWWRWQLCNLNASVIQAYDRNERGKMSKMKIEINSQIKWMMKRKKCWRTHGIESSPQVVEMEPKVILYDNVHPVERRGVHAEFACEITLHP